MDTGMYHQEVDRNMNSEGCVLYPCSKPKQTLSSFHTGRICLIIMSVSSEGENTSKKVLKRPVFWDCMAHVNLETNFTQKLCY